MAKELIGNDWDQVLDPVFASEKYHELHNFLREEYSTKQIYPDMYHIFTAFKLTSFAKTKVVILGQDPYHNPGQANGMSFSVMPGTPLPPSLKNIYKELYDDVGAQPVNHGYLKKWADQGVLLLNAVLTVPYGHANGHQGKGWEDVTDTAIKALSERGKVVFILWGRFAQNKIPLIDQSKNFIIKSSHPSPFSADRGFFAGAGAKPKDSTVGHTVTYVIYADGTIDVDASFTTDAHFDKSRLGLQAFFNQDFEQLTWYGRGPIENYQDRKNCAFVGRYQSTVTDMREHYVRAQSMGERTDTRWLTLTDKQGKGVKISGKNLFDFSALHYTDQAIWAAKYDHVLDEVAVPEVVLNLDCVMRGIGNGSCGPGPRPKYEIQKNHTYQYAFRLEPLK